MHRSAHDKVAAILSSYLAEHTQTPLNFTEIGSKVVEASQYDIKGLLQHTQWKYTGVDIESGNNVDVVISEPYHWKEIPSNSVDVLLCNQVFEHIRFPWVSIFEIARVLKPRGIAILIAPAGGIEHRWPYDCWRIYPDGWQALVEYSGALSTVEQYTQWKPLYYTDGSDKWQDSALVCQRQELSAQANAAFYEKAHQQRLLLNLESVLETPLASPPSVLPLFENKNALNQYEASRKATHDGYFVKYKRRRITHHLRALLKHLFLPERLIK